MQITEPFRGVRERPGDSPLEPGMSDERLQAFNSNWQENSEEKDVLSERRCKENKGLARLPEKTYVSA